jgi:hypothetical protein
MTLQAGEFIRLFLQRFRRIRHFGFLANTHRTTKLATIRALLSVAASEMAPEPADYRDRYAMLTGQSLDICPCCGGRMVEIAVLQRAQWPARSFWCDTS